MAQGDPPDSAEFLEDLTTVVDSAGRTRVICPGCGGHRYPGVMFDGICKWCGVTEHRCIGCGLVKPVGEFFPKRGSEYRTSRDWRCRACYNIQHREWGLLHPERVKAAQRKHQLGVTAEQYDAALASTPRCPICERPWDEVGTPHADHDHATGKFRGVLCGSCNRALGLFGDDPERLVRAAFYLAGGE